MALQGDTLANVGGVTGANVDLNTVRNLTETSTLSSLREAQHKDANGNLIGRYPSIGQTCHIADLSSSRARPFQPYQTTLRETTRHDQIVRESY